MTGSNPSSIDDASRVRSFNRRSGATVKRSAGRVCVTPCAPARPALRLTVAPNAVLSRRAARAHRAAFSLIELLVVVSLIMVLIALLLPSLGGIRNTARATWCKSNLTQLYKSMSITHDTKYRSLPNPGGWTDAVRQHGGQDALICPMGQYDEGQQRFEDAYITQRPGPAPLGVVFSYIEDIKRGVYTDPQIGVVWRGEIKGVTGENGRIGNWPAWAYQRSYGTPLGYEDMAVTLDDDAGLVVEYSRTPVRIVPLDPPSGLSGQPDYGTQWTNGGDMACGSDHWFCMGKSGADWQGEIVMRLTGNGYKNKLDPPATMFGASYGMNGLVNDNYQRTGQLLLMDYRKSVVDFQPDGNFTDDFDDWFAPRHDGKCNIITVGGAVELRSRAELDQDNPIWFTEPPTTP